MNMKRLLFVFQIIVVVVVLSNFVSCSFDDVEDKYPYSTFAFVYQDFNFNVIVGEGLKLDVGIILAGIISNKENRIAYYEVDPSLLDEVSDKTLLPANYYTAGHPNQIVVPKGDLSGYLPVKMDSLQFLADPRSLTGEFVLPIRLLISPSVDTLITEKSYIRISLSYLGKQFGNYYYSGEIDKTMAGVHYNFYRYSNNPGDARSIRFLETVGSTTFRMVGDRTATSDDPVKGGISFLIDVPINGTEVTILPDPDAPSDIRANGNCTYDAKNKKFNLAYIYTEADGSICTVVEELTFRNRIYNDQGNNIYINEWR